MSKETDKNKEKPVGGDANTSKETRIDNNTDTKKGDNVISNVHHVNLGDGELIIKTEITIRNEVIVKKDERRATNGLQNLARIQSGGEETETVEKTQENTEDVKPTPTKQ